MEPNIQTKNQKDEAMNKEILEIYTKLPQIIQDAIMKSGWENRVRNIVSKYQLRVDQGTQLENMTLALMMGQIDSKDYYESIFNEFGLDNEQARSMFDDLDQDVFGNIEDIIVQLENQQKKEKENIQERPTPQNYVRDDIDNVAMDDKIFTVTRDEILRGIENPDAIEKDEDIPGMEQSSRQTKESASFTAPSVSASTATQTESNTPANIPVKQEYENSYEEKSMVPEAPVSASFSENNNNIEIKEPELQAAQLKQETLREAHVGNNYVDNTNNQNVSGEDAGKPVDPVEAGLNVKISTSKPDYKASDPYREPIE